MSKWKITVILAVFVVSLIIVSHGLAMSSPNYHLEWFVPLTGSGGPVSSTHFAGNFTVGQTVVGASASPHYTSGLGYWYGMVTDFIRNFLPVVMRD